ncbi:unnamed protein product [Rhizoctonia solani]|uniref:Laminin domain protein n=1 Tax=Rhizoctonia solani TaxID=456999 RepID=A0A8H3CQV2_9AGAM|nr:unnamed protein product [Rhizoctonia solani]
MASTRVSRSGETVLVPPQLPAYLSDTYAMKPIVGKPTDEDVKTIHAVIRSLNVVAHLPALYNPDLSMQLSQHLFGAQMAVYRANYSTSILPGDQSVYTPPILPSHIPGTLDRVVGAPSDEEIKSAQSALRGVNSLAMSPQLFDTDLSMKLSQHVFNLQFARYMHDSAQGNFAADSGLKTRESSSVPQSTQEPQEIPTVNERLQNVGNGGQDNTRMSRPEQTFQAPSELAQQREAMKEIKDVLENMNRVLISVQRSQTTVRAYGDNLYTCYVYQNPVNQRGELASEYGLPQLRHYYWRGTNQGLILDSDQIARYLKFLGIGADMIQGNEEPKLIEGKEKEARNLLQKQVGFLSC